MSRVHSAPAVFFSVVLFGSLLLAAGAMGQTGIGKINRFAFAKNDHLVHKKSSDLTPVPEMVVRFKGKGHAIVRFCAISYMGGVGIGRTDIAVKLDGVLLGRRIQFLWSHDLSLLPRCFEWIAEDLEFGSHEVTIFWRVLPIGDSEPRASFEDRVLTVLYSGE